MLLHDNMNQCQMKVEEEVVEEGGGRNVVGGGVRGVNRECISFCLQSYPFPSSPLKKYTKQHDRRECKQRTRDRQQGISNVNLLRPSEYILNAWLRVVRQPNTVWHQKTFKKEAVRGIEHNSGFSAAALIIHNYFHINFLHRHLK